jgi:hypothetical protein
MRTITCSCDSTFEADLPESINLDAQPEQKDALAAGAFMTVACPNCGRTLKPEFLIHVSWPSRGLDILAVPELDRVDIPELASKEGVSDAVAGYAELADRVSVAAAGLDPTTIEALKYYLLLRASEADPDAEVSAWFHSVGTDFLEFHLHGLRPGEVAVSRIPRSLYERTLAEGKAHPDKEPFRSLRKGCHLSVQNLFGAEA